MRRHLDDIDPGLNVSGGVTSTLKAAARRELHNLERVTDKSERATVEQVLDPRTRLVLYKMLTQGLFREVNGCVSTGKEANVYHATAGHLAEFDLAVKVYKTSILVFKDRDRYVTGDYRFRGGYNKHNPRKMVKLWAEKEFRNLNRLRSAGIPAPKPVQLKTHVLVMEFIGHDGKAAPRLKDAGLNSSQLRSAYTEMILNIRTLYQDCKLVHGDLSEYNILFYKEQLYIIDVSQSVDLDHPHALTFLREDCLHVNDYFRRQGLQTLTVRELFDFAVDPTVTPANLDATLDALIEKASNRPAAAQEDEDVQDRVFQQVFIPRRLDEVVNYERDVDRARRAADTTGAAAVEGAEEAEAPSVTPSAAPPAAVPSDMDPGAFYRTITGMRSDLQGPQLVPRVLEGRKASSSKKEKKESKAKGRETEGPEEKAAVSEEEEMDAEERERQARVVTTRPAVSDSDEDEDGSDDDEASGSGSGSDDGDGSDSEEEREWRDENGVRLTKEQVREQRRENKKLVKEAKREKRKTKVPKKVKRKNEAKSKKKR